MNNKDLTQDLVMKFGEAMMLEQILDNCLKLSVTIQEHKNIDFKEDYTKYSESYNTMCERIADMKLALNTAEFLFDSREIDKHYDTKILNLYKSLS
jgi:hypothetical protein